MDFIAFAKPYALVGAAFAVTDPQECLAGGEWPDGHLRPRVVGGFNDGELALAGF
jgi:hypothetical protein